MLRPLLTLALLSVSPFISSCAQQLGTTPKAIYIPVDPKKYKSQDAIVLAMSVAQRECAQPKNSTEYQTGRNAVSAVKASMDEVQNSAIDACMAGRGFLRKE